MKHIIIASTSTLFGGAYLEYLTAPLKSFFRDIPEIVFIPYARPGGISHEAYTGKANEAFSKLGIRVRGIHEFDKPQTALRQAKGIFVGGGNTFVLVHQLYKQNLMEVLREVVLAGTPYLGTSAGSNICGLTMQTTNDMPIMYPPSFKTLGLVPFNINPHYLDPDSHSHHMGETRETRIKEFHCINTVPVVGLREGSWMEVQGASITLRGALPARVFEANKPPYEIETNTSLTDLK